MKHSVLSYAAAAVAFLTLFAAPASIRAEDPPTSDSTKLAVVPGDTPIDYGADPLRFLENDRVKLGLDLSLGGAVTYLEDKANKSGNMINSFDWGRQIQLSYYSGPVPYIGPNGEKPFERWAGLGWNPIQSGDCGRYRSYVLEFKRISDKEAFLRARPMLWPNSGVPAECVFECRYELMDNGFVLDATIVNNRSDKTQYPARNQETPAVYTNAPWYKLVSYLGDKPFENEPVTTVVDKADGKGWPWRRYYSPERWTALVNEKNYGVGVYQPFSTLTSGGFHGGDAAKGQNLGPKDVATGYIAPWETTILDWNIRRTYRATFIVGSVDEIRSTVYKLAKNDLPETPNWVFQGDRQNWSYIDATDEGYPIADALKINLKEGAQAIAKSPDIFWKTENAKTLEIDCALTQEKADVDGGVTVRFTPVSPADGVDYLQWSEGAFDRDKDRAEKEKTRPRLPQIYVDAPVKFDGKRRVVSVDLSKVEGYSGAMKSVEIIFPKTNGKATLYRVGFVK
ncbi:MAG: hypothetical protein II561_01970 [Thermoguttaceae bacterium]|nr:hypothetical protein [Thermoguttaceae bacterium]